MMNYSNEQERVKIVKYKPKKSIGQLFQLIDISIVDARVCSLNGDNVDAAIHITDARLYLYDLMKRLRSKEIKENRRLKKCPTS